MDGGITSGYLEKWTNYVTGWKPRFFIVQEGMLSYYASKASVRDGTRGSMVLSEARVIQIDGTSFKITAGSTAFYLRASNSKELKAWIKVLDPLSKPADRRGSWASPSQTSKLHRTVGVSSDETGRSYEHQTLPSRLVFPQLPSPESAEGPADLSMSEQLKHGASAAEAAEIRSLCSKLEHFEQSFNRYATAVDAKAKNLGGNVELLLRRHLRGVTDRKKLISDAANGMLLAVDEYSHAIARMLEASKGASSNDDRAVSPSKSPPAKLTPATKSLETLRRESLPPRGIQDSASSLRTDNTSSSIQHKSGRVNIEPNNDSDNDYVKKRKSKESSSPKGSSRLPCGGQATPEAIAIQHLGNAFLSNCTIMDTQRMAHEAFMRQQASALDKCLGNTEMANASADEKIAADAVIAELAVADCSELSPRDVLQLIRGNAQEAQPLEEAKKASKKISAWRREVEFLTRIRKEHCLAVEFHRLWSENIYGEDCWGHPLIGITVSSIDSEGLMKMDPEELSACVAQKLALYRAYMEYLTLERGQQIYKQSFLLDMSNVSMGSLLGQKKATMQRIFSLGSNYFPESVWKIYIINAPFAVRMGWSVIKALIHPVTQAKINIIGSVDAAKEVLRNDGYLPHNVPRVVGGTNRGIACGDLLRAVQQTVNVN